MKKGLTELVFILDRSGSMAGLEGDTIGGFNGMLNQQRSQEGSVNVTTVLFDDQYEMLHDRFSLDIVRPMTEADYYVRGCTALLDAIGHTLQKMIHIQNYLPEEQKAEKVIFVITTDGMENASRVYSYDKIRRMIEHQKKENDWEFMFLGANMDAVSVAGRFGIGANRAVTYENDSVGVQTNYRAVSQAICSMRSAPQMASVGDSWKKEIEEDVKRRKRFGIRKK